MPGRGASVEISNDPLEEVIERVAQLLKDRGVAMNFDGSTDVAEIVFYLPISMLSAAKEEEG
jgi:hypothetical protein